jgi:para-nitrobenzyl esterase
MIAALDFVRENIGAFGGDKNNITAFGQSAGAMATQSLVCSKLTQGKIHQAILQSGGGYKMGFGRRTSPETMEKWGGEFIQYLGAASPEDLKKIPAERLLEAQKALSQRAMQNKTEGPRFAPYADGVVLEGDTDTLIEKGGLHDIPYMLGSTAGDMGTAPGADAKEGMLYKGCAAFSTFNETLGRKPAWVYYFTQRPQGDNLGAYHSSELWYMFGTLSRSWRPKTPGDWELSSRMLSYWCNFMKQGDPNGAALPPWKPCKKDEPFVMELGNSGG